MSEKNEAGLNKLDMQAMIAAWIVAYNGCFELEKWVSCSGEGGFFNGISCPLSSSRLQTENMSAPACDPQQRAIAAKEWLEKYHQQKAEAAEAEKRKVEAAKKQEQETKQASCGTCEECKHIGNVYATVIYCKEKDTRVPVGFAGCPDFKSRAAADKSHSVSRECVVDVAAYDERIVQLKNEVYKAQDKYACLADKYIDCKEKLNLRKEGVLLLEKENANLADKCERLTEQRNRLSNSLIEQRNSLIEATRRTKEVERENNALTQELAGCTAKCKHLGGVCDEKDGLIGRLRKENAELRSRYEQLNKDSFQRLFEALCKNKVLKDEIDRLIIGQAFMQRVIAALRNGV